LFLSHSLTQTLLLYFGRLQFIYGYLLGTTGPPPPSFREPNLTENSLATVYYGGTFESPNPDDRVATFEKTTGICKNNSRRDFCEKSSELRRVLGGKYWGPFTKSLSSRPRQAPHKTIIAKMSAPPNNNLNSPHLTNLQNGSAPASPGMSHQQHQPQNGPQPGYAPQQAYASPSMQQPQNYYAQPPQPQEHDQYRTSPTGNNGAMALPSMRLPDAMPQQQHQIQQHMGQPLPPPGAQMNQQYYHQPGQILPPPPPHQYPVTSDPNAMRYVLPIQHDSRIMSGGRHKKVSVDAAGLEVTYSASGIPSLTITQEIKRRTKTGCLTCRKRRIKVRFQRVLLFDFVFVWEEEKKEVAKRFASVWFSRLSQASLPKFIGERSTSMI
jgi:hypothetical protein